MNTRKGIVLAGGSGTRLYPLTVTLSKQLLPIYDKPMVYYSMSMLLLANIRNILIISSPRDITQYINLFQDGSHLGLSIQYAIQQEPKGIAQAFIAGRDFVGNNPSALVLGDNIFHGDNLTTLMSAADSREDGATIFSYQVSDPYRYGVVKTNRAGQAVFLEEKPTKHISNMAVTGLYFYDNRVLDIAKNLTPSPRGEFEITDVNKEYMTLGKLYVQKLGRGTTWLDTGTHDSLLEASNFVQTVQARQGLKVACIEEIAYTQGFIDAEKLEKIASKIGGDYGKYLSNILEQQATL